MPDDLPAPIRDYIDAYNAKDVDRMIDCLADHVTFENRSGGAVDTVAKTRAEFRQLAESAVQLFASRKQEVKNHITVAGTTLVEIEYHAVLAADLPNGMKAGQIVQLSGRSLFDLGNDGITRLIDES